MASDPQSTTKNTDNKHARAEKEREKRRGGWGVCVCWGGTPKAEGGNEEAKALINRRNQMSQAQYSYLEHGHA